MKKKIFMTFIVSLLLFNLVACGVTASNPNNPNNTETVKPSVPENENPPQPDAGNPNPPTTPDKPSDPEIPSTPLDKYTTYVKSVTANLSVRASASFNGSVVGKMDKGDLLYLESKQNDWYKVKYKNGYAYVSASESYTQLYIIKQNEKNIESVLQVGYSLLGTEYVYGAVRYHDGRGNLLYNFSKKYFDCSSLTQYMFYIGAGVLMDTTSRSQSLQGKFVNASNIQRGDVMFFTNSTRFDNTGIERIGHVGVFLGNNYILHTSSDFAVIEEINTTRWNYLISVKRFV
ncbi:MAG: NlpC/P60 family protein [Clostridia bacterium]